MDRFDGKGYKPQIRPFSPHRKRERAKLKVTKSILPKWQLAMMKLGMNFVVEEDGRIKLCRLTEPDVFETSATTLEEPMCMDMACGEVGDYAMLEAVPSRPPPKHGWARKVLLSAVVFLCKALTLAGIMALANACKKAPVPEPNPTHHYPDTIYVPFELKPAIIEANPNMDTIKFYADKPDVKKIIMDLKPMDSLQTAGWYWTAFHKARDTLQSRIKIAPDKVIGRGTIIVSKVVPDSMDYVTGLPRFDSIAFRQMGFDIYVRHNH